MTRLPIVAPRIERQPTSRTTGSATTVFSHDARGNRLNDGATTYAYDSESKARGVASAPWHYDPLGRLSGAGNSPGTPPAIAYESYVDNLVAERTPGSSSVVYRHVFGPGTDEPLVWYNGPGTADRRFLQADERGSVVAVTSDAGALLAINRYDEHGRTETSNAVYRGRRPDRPFTARPPAADRRGPSRFGRFPAANAGKARRGAARRPRALPPAGSARR